MSFNFNKVIIGGRLTADPELKVTPSGTSVTSFVVAVDRNVGKDAEKKADFINVVAWRQTAEFITRYFRKGSSLCIVGALQVRSWNDQNGNKRYTTEIVAGEAYFVDSKSDTAQNTIQVVAPTVTPQFKELSDDEEFPF